MNPRPFPRCAGMSYGYMAPRGHFASAAAQEDVRRMAAAGVRWIALHPLMVQDTFASTTIYHHYRISHTDAEILAFIDDCHRQGVGVMLKPMVHPLDGCWQGRISFPGDAPGLIQGTQLTYWSRWFASFAAGMAHYAELAQRSGCGMFCLGCELLGTMQESAHWKAVIEQVRSIYSGWLVTDIQVDASSVRLMRDPTSWMSGFDALGISFYEGCTPADDTVESIVAAFAARRQYWQEVATAAGKPIFFAEAGCRSVAGILPTPWNPHLAGPYDGEVQARYLEAIIRAYSDASWWKGLFWWKWDERQQRPHFSQPGGDTGFTIAGKPAERTLATAYAAMG